MYGSAKTGYTLKYIAKTGGNLNSWLGEAYKIDKFNKFIWWLYLPCSILMQAAV